MQGPSPTCINSPQVASARKIDHPRNAKAENEALEAENETLQDRLETILNIASEEEDEEDEDPEK